jgi:hypothetical protein
LFIFRVSVPDEGQHGRERSSEKVGKRCRGARICSSVIMRLIIFLLVAVGLDHGQYQTLAHILGNLIWS